MINYLDKIKLPGRNRLKPESRTILFQPPYKDRGSITVIAGRNGTGKSYLLRAIEKCLINHNLELHHNKVNKDQMLSFHDITVYVKDFSKQIGSIIRISDINDLSRNAESITTNPFGKKVRKGVRDRKSVISNQVSILNSLQSFFAEILDKYQHDSKFNFSFDRDKWNEENNPTYRESFFKHFDETKVYRIPEAIELVKIFESYVDGKLYIGLTKRRGTTSYFEIYLCKNTKSTITFQNWSDGQKVTFISFLMVIYNSPEILLFDEIENHLHPALISRLFKFFAKHVPQTIIATHHPHIIFSRYSDSTWYIDKIEENNHLEPILEKNVKDSNRGHLRRCIELKNNYEKLVQVYQLFQNSDNKLLKLSSSVIENLDQKLYKIFTSLFKYDIILSNPNGDPDIQSDELYQYFSKSLNSSNNISVLEIGAGYGRLLEELIKIDPAVSTQKLHWTLFEPFEDVATKLIQTISKYSMNHCEVKVQLESISKKFDFIIYPNILHEITPKSIAEYFHFSLNNLTKNGTIIIVDIFPLIMPEKFSVPFKISEWEKLLGQLNLGFKTRKVNFKQSSFDAYWIEVKKNENTVIEIVEITKIISDFYNDEIITNRCKEYSRRKEFDDMRESIGLMCELTSIASIASYKKGVWKT